MPRPQLKPKQTPIEARRTAQEARILGLAVSSFCKLHELPVREDAHLSQKQKQAVCAGSPSITLTTLARLEAIAAERGAPQLLANLEQQLESFKVFRRLRESSHRPAALLEVAQ